MQCGNYGLNFFIIKFRINWYTQYSGGKQFCAGERFILLMWEGLLSVYRNGIMYQGINTTFLKVRHKSFSLIASYNKEMVARLAIAVFLYNIILSKASGID